MKTGCVALVLCLNISVDPPDVIKISPCARMECWIGIVMIFMLLLFVKLKCLFIILIQILHFKTAFRYHICFFFNACIRLYKLSLDIRIRCKFVKYNWKLIVQPPILVSECIKSILLLDIF